MIRAAGLGRRPFLSAEALAFWSATRAPFFPPREPATVHTRPRLPGIRPAASAIAALWAVRFSCVLSTFVTAGLAFFRATATIFGCARARLVTVGVGVFGAGLFHMQKGEGVGRDKRSIAHSPFVTKQLNRFQERPFHAPPTLPPLTSGPTGLGHRRSRVLVGLLRRLPRLR